MTLEQIIQEILKVLGLFSALGILFYIINYVLDYLFRKLDEKLTKDYNNKFLPKKEHQDKLTKLRYGIKGEK